MQHVKFSIQNKLILAVFAISTAVTALFIATTFVFDFYQESEDLNSNIYFIEKNNLEPISKLLWDYNQSQLQTQIESLSALPQVVSVSLESSDGENKIKKNNPNLTSNYEKNIIKKYNLTYGSTEEIVGSLTIEYDRQHIFKKLYDKALFTILAQTIKSIIISILLFLAFRYLVTSRILLISSFLQDINDSKFEQIDPKKLFKKNKKYFVFSSNDEITNMKKILLKMAYRTKKYNQEFKAEIVDAKLEAENQKAIAVQSNKLAAIGELASSVAHEINNPLSVIQTRVELIKKYSDLQNQNNSDEINKHVLAIEKMNLRISKIVKSLLIFSRDGSGEIFSSIDLRDLFEDLQLLVFEKARKKNIDVRVDCPSLILECKPTKVSQILTNLVSNAIDAIEFSENPWIAVSVKIEKINESEFVCIEVKDSGCGISQDIQKKLMTPFFTTKPKGKGVGIGLNISKKMAEEQGGHLTLNTSSENTCFILSLPLKQKSQISIPA